MEGDGTVAMLVVNELDGLWLDETCDSPAIVREVD
jgi:hypothetical protein